MVIIVYSVQNILTNDIVPEYASDRSRRELDIFRGPSIARIHSIATVHGPLARQIPRQGAHDEQHPQRPQLTLSPQISPEGPPPPCEVDQR